MSRLRVLCLVRYYLPGYKSGGPTRTIANMVEHLGDELDFRIVTADRDHADSHSYPDVAVDDWNAVGKAQVFYTSPGARSLRSLARLIGNTEHDVLYLNSFFESVFTVRAMLARRLGLVPRMPVVLAPRGEFSPGALTLKSWKKRLFSGVARASGLYRDVTWQASSEYEANELRLALGSLAERVVVAPDLAPLAHAVPAHAATRRQVGAALRVCFLSRIEPKKNLDFALRVLSRTRAPVEFDIYGPIEDEAYWRRCQASLAALRAPVHARYQGSLPHARVGETLASYDLFFLPTLGENFGHVILESLLAGTPVLIADTTPWRNLQALAVGWDLPLRDEQAFVAAIEAALALDADKYASWRERVAAYGHERSRDRAVVDANKRLFREVARGSSGSDAAAILDR